MCCKVRYLLVEIFSLAFLLILILNMRLDLIERMQITKIVECGSQKLIPVIHFRKRKYKSMLNALELNVSL